jgi:hypothetical protein
LHSVLWKTGHHRAEPQSLLGYESLEPLRGAVYASRSLVRVHCEGEARLADPRLTTDKHETTLSSRCGIKVPKEHGQLTLASGERWLSRGLDHLHLPVSKCGPVGPTHYTPSVTRPAGDQQRCRASVHGGGERG